MVTFVVVYSNFEALEAEFDRFNFYYPNVTLTYEKLDDYNNSIATVLESDNKPNIFFSYIWMMGNDKYNSVVSHMENLSDAKLKLDLNCLRQSLVTKSELNSMASLKRSLTPTKELTFDPVYAPFAKIPASRTFSPEVLRIN